MRLLSVFVLVLVLSVASFVEPTYRVDICEVTSKAQGSNKNANCSTIPECTLTSPCDLQLASLIDPRIRKDTGSISHGWWALLKQVRVRIAPVSDKAIKFDILNASGDAIYTRLLQRDDAKNFLSAAKTENLNYKLLLNYHNKPSLKNARIAAKSFFDTYSIKASAL